MTLTRRSFIKALGSIGLAGWLPTPNQAFQSDPDASTLIVEDIKDTLYGLAASVRETKETVAAGIWSKALWPGLDKWYQEEYKKEIDWNEMFKL